MTKTTISLSTLGSRGVQINVMPAALEEAGPEGVQIELSLPDGLLTLSLSAQEATALADALREVRRNRRRDAEWPAVRAPVRAESDPPGP
jgi:hypothetical protein